MIRYRLAAARQAEVWADWLAQQATQALIDEARLSPKPGLVDRRGSGAHQDLTLALMERSAHSLTDTFYALALYCCSESISGTSGYHYFVNTALRQEVGRLGRLGERQMLDATDGVNTHRGAIWALGLLVSAAAMQPALSACTSPWPYLHLPKEHSPEKHSPEKHLPKKYLSKTASQIAKCAAAIAQLPDAFSPKTFSKGAYAVQRYQVPGAREEAQQGFPHVVRQALPMLRNSRLAGASESQAQLNALLAIMTTLADTCVLSRGGMPALQAMHLGAQAVLCAGGVQSPAGQQRFVELEQRMMTNNASPGGAADLLAAALFLDRIVQTCPN